MLKINKHLSANKRYFFVSRAVRAAGCAGGAVSVDNVDNNLVEYR